jgi:hypothetical protein
MKYAQLAFQFLLEPNKTSILGFMISAKRVIAGDDRKKRDARRNEPED